MGVIISGSDVRVGPKIVDTGLLLYLDAGNVVSYPGTGTTWTDLSGKNNHATLSTNIVGGTVPTYDPSNLGNLTTNFTNQSFIQLPINPVWNFGFNSFSVGVWFKTTETDDLKLGNLFVYDNASTNGLWALFGATNSIIFQVYDVSRFPTANRSVTAVVTPNDGKWHYVMGVRDVSTTSIGIYFDGTLRNTQLESPTLDVTASPTTYPAIGRRGSAPFLNPVFSNYSNYTVSMAHVYNRALTAPEVLQNYNSFKGRFGII